MSELNFGSPSAITASSVEGGTTMAALKAAGGITGGHTGEVVLQSLGANTTSQSQGR